VSIIKIGEGEKPLSEASESWIVHQVRARESDGGLPCVQIFVKCSSVDLILSTPQCAGVGGGGRLPNQKEQEIFELWNSRHLNRPDWAVGNLIALIKQLQKHLC
jgi:hypothetical protein